MYGLGNPGIPAQQVLQALHTSVAAQKAPDGIQHPNGDALTVAEQFFASGGKSLQIYMQDIYKEWPYEKLGMDDYLPKIKKMVLQGKMSPYREKLSYIPLNEPDVIWYNDSFLFRDFCADWKKCYETIKEVDPNAKVAGPNTTIYNERFMDRFLKFCKINLFNIKTSDSPQAENLIVQVRKADSNVAKAIRYEAKSSENEMSERVAVNKKGNLVEQKRAVNQNQFILFKNVNVQNDGIYALTIKYQNGELGDGASNYNANIVDRSTT